MPFVTPTTFIPDPIQANTGEDDKKRLFGVELAKGHASPFEAACEVFSDTRKALWASQHWQNDPVVIASRDLYSKSLIEVPALLDKEALAAKVLQLAEEKNEFGTRYLVDAKERVAALKLYAEIIGAIGKNAETTNNNNLTDNSMTITIVSAEPKEAQKVIEAVPNNEAKIINEGLDHLKIKLVS